MKKILKNKKGFTLIELLAVIVVLAIVMLIALNNITKQGEKYDWFYSNGKTETRQSRLLSVLLQYVQFIANQ